MKREKILLSVTVTMVAITGAILGITGGLKSSSFSATNGEVWHHFAAVAPTATTHGSKEFWASSINGCATHQFTDPGVTCVEHDFSKYDSFASLSRDDDRYVWCLNEQWGITPVFGEKTVTYGIYPQTVVDDESLITALNGLSETSGYYFYKNAYYAKVKATVELDYHFDNGAQIVDGTTYWFKCEPITWNVLSNANGERYILSSVVLDAYCYYEDTGYRWSGGEKICPNNYEYSDIRDWLNIDFYNSAFALHNSYIQETTVDNSALTTNPIGENPYACNNTEDNVFLPSFKDYINPDYFDKTSARYCKTTDWARAKGAYYDTRSSYLFNGTYWTRSPSDADDVQAWCVDGDGNLGTSDCYRTYYGVRPALSIKIA
ncbi:MAG: hypothetical protein E7182_03675 [Erysipelotrichaceae bacterium]|nr:hypothetical protein [Erysipelotrichaceae bacterium]